MVDYATRYPEAVALKYIDSERVAEALFEMFSRVGVPNEILSDMGRQFTSDVIEGVGRLLSMKQMTTTPYNPACNGLVERFNGTLKNMLKKMCAEQPKQWDRYIAPLLFAYREAPQESLAFSPFELLYGRTVRGTLAILKELWTNEIESEEVRTTYQYVLDLRNRLEETLKLAGEELAKNRGRYKAYADRKRKPKNLNKGDQVLILLPTDHNKLLMQLRGPFVIKDKVNEYDYKVTVKGKDKLYHANMLRKYVDREQVVPDEEVAEDDGDEDALSKVCIAVIEEGTDDCCDMTEEETEPDKYIKGKAELAIELPRFEAKESVADVRINPELTTQQREQLQDLVSRYPDVLNRLTW